MKCPSLPRPLLRLTQFMLLALAATLLFAPSLVCAQTRRPTTGRDTLRGSGRGSIPTEIYARAIESLYENDYRDAERTFKREIRSAIKIGVTDRWLDSIAYHTMLGETYYHQGRLGEALEQFDQACMMYLNNPTWMVRIKFRREPTADTNRLRRPLPWGKSNRQFTLGRYPLQESISFGDSGKARRAAKQGGVFQMEQLWQVNVIEIVRTTALAIRRRNELLGPLGAEDAISRDLVTALSRGTTIPNHWSKGWADLLLGVANVGVGKSTEAEKYLQRAERLAGRYDHPLTCVALLELGKIKLEAGDLQAAAPLFAEASYSAFYYEDIGTINEAFRLGTICHLASWPEKINPTLEFAAKWASQKRHHQLNVQLNLAITEELLHLGDSKSALATLRSGTSRLRDAKTGLLGLRAQYLDALMQYRQERESAQAALTKVIQQSIGLSTHNLQLQILNQRYDQRQIRARSATGIYQTLLADPKATDWLLHPFESLARLQTPHDAAFTRWLDASLARKNPAAALEISDLAKRYQYQSSLAWGGRMAALRDTLEKPEHLLSPHTLNQRNEILLRYPEYGETAKAGRKLQAEINKKWQPNIEDSEQRELVKTWRNWSKSLTQRESMIGQIGLQRVAANMQFPPVLAATDVQQRLEKGQAIVVFHEMPAGMRGFLLTSGGSTSWQCASSKKIKSLLSEFLRDLGNYDANFEMAVPDLLADKWQQSGDELYAALFEGSSLDPAQLEELVIVPDGMLWYVPFTALPVTIKDKKTPLISIARVRMAPTMGLAMGDTQPWRRVMRTGVVGQEILPGENDEARTEALDTLEETLENPIHFSKSLPAPTPIMGSLLQTLVVLDEIELDLSKPLDWTPIPQGRGGKRSSLSYWLLLPQFCPQRIVMPATRTIAERGLKVAKRKSSNVRPGTELFLASCSLLSTGTQTALLSSWRVGGDATFELSREFLQELPFTGAATAWQRSVKLARELPLIPEKQPRVKSNKKDQDKELTAAHPFFWAGYLLIDTGAPGSMDEEEEKEAPPAESVPVPGKPKADDK